MNERPTIRLLVDGRRMQCKDIPDAAVLDAVRIPGDPGRWRMSWDVQQALEMVVGPLPDNLFRAKIRSLFARKILGGCACGCRGDFHLVTDCQGGVYCCLDEPAA